MHRSRNTFLTVAAVAALAFGFLSLQARSTSADEPAAGFGAMMRRHLATKVITIRIDDKRGEPQYGSVTASFDRNVEAYWISVTGVDVKFRGSTEKQINRQMFEVDPIAKVNGRNVEVNGKLGIRDGSGNWDDRYEGVITVAVTAILAD